MKYKDAKDFAYIARPSWKGFYVDTSSNKIVYRHADVKYPREIDFVPTPVELACDDWELVTQT